MNLIRLVYRTPVNIAGKYVYGTHFKQVFLKFSNLITLKSLFYHKFESFLLAARKKTNRCRAPIMDNQFKLYEFSDIMNSY